jgi:hypothetical protein
VGEGRGWGGKEYEGWTPVVCNFFPDLKISQAFIIIMIISGFFNIKVFNVKYSLPVVDAATKFLVAATLMNPFY